MTVWIYDQGEDLKVFATEEAAKTWLDESEPEGVLVHSGNPPARAQVNV